jgi:hypothetical protein
MERVERIQHNFVRFALRWTVNPLPAYDSRCALLGLESLEDRRTMTRSLFIRDLLCNKYCDLFGFSNDESRNQVGQTKTGTGPRIICSSSGPKTGIGPLILSRVNQPMRTETLKKSMFSALKVETRLRSLK